MSTAIPGRPKTLLAPTLAGQGEQGVEVVWHLAAVAVHQLLGGRDDVFGLGAKQADRPDKGLDPPGRGLSQAVGVGIGLEERGRGGVDADIGRLGREDRGDQELKRRAELEFSGGVGVAASERGEHAFGSASSGGGGFSWHGGG